MLSNSFRKIRDSEVGEDVLGQLFGTIRSRQLASELAIASLGVAEGRVSTEVLDTLYAQLREEQERTNSADAFDSSEFVCDDLETLYTETWSKPGLRWRLNSLNKSLGSLRKGDFGFVFARPETGKTTFLASEVTYMASQLDKETDGPVLWINNEEQGSKVQIRVYQAALGYTLTELMSNREGNQQKYKDITNGKIRLLDSASIHKKQIERVCEQLKPSLIIFDQIDKIKGFAADREDLRLGAIYIWARELAKKYCPAIGVCQADGQGEGVKWLTMEHVANAKTSKQAEADWILGIGCIHDPVFEFIRFINISKNKLQGDEDTDPKKRHGRIECKIKPDIARYADYE